MAFLFIVPFCVWLLYRALRLRLRLRKTVGAGAVAAGVPSPAAL